LQKQHSVQRYFIGLESDWTGMDLDYNKLDLDLIRTINRFINLDIRIGFRLS